MNTTHKTHKNQLAYPIIIITLCAGFLFYKYILQIYPSIITDQLMREFHLTGAGLGNLAATFYYAYMVTQLFVGIMLDKYSPRWLTSFAIFCCAMGVLLFSESHTVLQAGLSRALMGTGVAFATVAYMKIAAMWFSPRSYAFVGGLLATAAMTGAVFGQAPLALLVNQLGWRNCLYIVGLLGVALAFLFVCIVRDKNADVVNETPAKKYFSYHDVIQVFKNKQNWLLTLYSGLAFSPVAIFGGLWGNPFLEQAYNLNKTQAASMISLVFIGLGIGSPVLGLISEHLENRRGVMLLSTLLAFAAIVVVLYVHPIPLWLTGTLLFLFGFGLGSFMLVFTIGKEINNITLVATVIAMINTSDAVLDAITEPLIGKFLDFTWDGTVINGIHHFSLQSYHIALSILPIYLIVGCLLLLGVKEAKHTHRVDAQP